MTPDKVKQNRKQLNLTQRGLENYLNLAGTDGSTVRKWESGKRQITGPCIKLINIALKHGVDFI